MADDRRVDIDIVANDLASAVFNQVSANASSIFDKLTSGITKTNYALRMYNTSMAGFNNTIASLMRTSGNAIYSFTKDSITEFANLERQHAQTMGAMQSNYAKTAESQQQFLEDSKKLQEQAISLGKNGPTGQGSLYSSTEISSVQTELVKSGISASDILDTDVLNSVVKFAGGNDLDLTEATDFAVNLSTQFGIAPADWGEMLDKVTKAADISPIEVTDIMESMKYAGGIASGLDRSIDEVLGMISVMGMAGVTGNMAGTGVQAMFARILAQQDLTDTQIGNAPSEYVGNLYNAFRDDIIQNGDLADMSQVTEDLNDAFEVLNDEEQAWFAKKMFGLYQMKAAYALARNGDDGSNLLAEAIDQISNSSEGTLDYKYQAMLESSYGTITGLQNALIAIKQDFGEDLSPITKNVATQLHDWLVDPANYEIDWDALESAIQESGGLIAEGYGEEIANAVKNIGYFGVDAAQIISAIGPPRATSLVTGLTQLFNGDISGALSTFTQGISDSNDAIDGLPEDLQDTAKACNDVITFFEILAALNVATQITQGITSIITLVETLLIRPLAQTIGKIATGSVVGSAAESAISNIANVNAMNVANASVVNVNGAVVNVAGAAASAAAGAAASAAAGATGTAIGIAGSKISGLLGSGAVAGIAGSKISGLLGSGSAGAAGTATGATGATTALSGLAGSIAGTAIVYDIYNKAKKLFGLDTSDIEDNYTMYVHGSQSEYNDYGMLSWQYMADRLKYGYIQSDEANNKMSSYGSIVSQLVQEAYTAGTISVHPINESGSSENEATSISLMASYIQGIADNWLQQETNAGNVVTDDQYIQYVYDIITAISELTTTLKDRNSFEANVGSLATGTTNEDTQTSKILEKLDEIYNTNTSTSVGTNPGILVTGAVGANGVSISEELKSAIESSDFNLTTKMYTEKSITLNPNFNINVTVDSDGNIKSMITSPSVWSRIFSDSYTTQSSRYGS